MLLGCGTLGAPLGMLLAPARPCWPLGWKPLDPPSRRGVRPCCWATLRAGLCFHGKPPAALGAPLGAGSSTVLRYHPAWRGPRVGESRHWVPPAPARLPRQRCRGSALLVSPPLQPVASHLASPQPLPMALGFPKLLPSFPHSWGINSRFPWGQGCSCRQGLRFPPFPSTGIADGALQLLCRLQAGSWRRLEWPISRIGMCGLKSILLV